MQSLSFFDWEDTKQFVGVRKAFLKTSFFT